MRQFYARLSPLSLRAMPGIPLARGQTADTVRSRRPQAVLVAVPRLTRAERLEGRLDFPLVNPQVRREEPLKSSIVREVPLLEVAGPTARPSAGRQVAALVTPRDVRSTCARTARRRLRWASRRGNEGRPGTQ